MISVNAHTAQETTQKVDSDTGHGTTASFAENIRPLGGKRQFVATESAHNCQGICHRSLLRDVASARTKIISVALAIIFTANVPLSFSLILSPTL